ncbi:hypothetical protein MGAST_06580 [Mycobacterium gastri 'Wayne']|uniref:Dihydroprymidine dehydrogenase domain-containing protein n=1 Tax=Mycobacterium gastri TaxID=1777 RepID=A0A1X1VGS2_MYCGS|nr:hypothetical protein [Mycobacterium gastri]ETW24764.1 hypothetical protein MGAST_06580 [Mycobacterium gastri 'Wayne']ORV68129.1 hypothetical protein AWC07_08750 [Mycobacterium gastri]
MTPGDTDKLAPRGDLTALPDLLHGAQHAGPIRDRRPVYVDLLPPCNAECPAGENIQAWLADARAGRHEQAWRRLVAIHRRVCCHPCESSCSRAYLDATVAIHAVERFLGDTAMDATRVARRPGAEDTVIIYRRTAAQTPSHAHEVHEAEREGVRINWLRTSAAFDHDELQVELMELDESGRPQPTRISRPVNAPTTSGHCAKPTTDPTTSN